jgi:hypothetical protein
MRHTSFAMPQPSVFELELGLALNDIAALSHRRSFSTSRQSFRRPENFNNFKSDKHGGIGEPGTN